MPECSLVPKSFVSLLFVALLNPKLNPYLLFKFLIFYHSSSYIVIMDIATRTMHACMHGLSKHSMGIAIIYFLKFNT